MSISRKTLARLSLGMAPVLTIVGLSAGPAAAARPRNGTTPASCDVVDSDSGEVVGQVPEGTRVGLFYCGSDGDWHFGTVILDHKLSADPTTGGSGTGSTGGVRGGLGNVASGRTKATRVRALSIPLTSAAPTRAAH